MFRPFLLHKPGVMCSRQTEGGSKPHVRLADEHGTYLGVCERASSCGGWLCSEGLTIAHNGSGLVAVGVLKT